MMRPVLWGLVAFLLSWVWLPFTFLLADLSRPLPLSLGGFP